MCSVVRFGDDSNCFLLKCGYFVNVFISGAAKDRKTV